MEINRVQLILLRLTKLIGYKKLYAKLVADYIILILHLNIKFYYLYIFIQKKAKIEVKKISTKNFEKNIIELKQLYNLSNIL